MWLCCRDMVNLLQRRIRAKDFQIFYLFGIVFHDCRFDYDVPTEGRTMAEIYCDLVDKDAYYNSAWSKIIRRSLLIDNNIRFEKGIVGEDNEWYYHVVMVANSLVLVDENLYIYRRRQGSTTTTTTRKNLLDQLYVLDKWEKILEVKLYEWEVRDMDSSWGTCSKAKKKALFNLQLAKKPTKCIEYVVAHELTHLIEQKHNDRFKRILDTYLPDWEAIRKELNEFPL